MSPSKLRFPVLEDETPPRRGAAKKAVARVRGGREGAPLAEPLTNRRGLIMVDRVAATFGMSKGELAEMIGLKREALYKLARLEAPKPQSRLREMLEIIARVSGWAGGDAQAMAWYRAQPIAAFGGHTAEALVKDGQAGALRHYLDHIALGGFS